QSEEGEEAHQHALVDVRRAGEAHSTAVVVTRAGARVHRRGRMRRGDADQRAPAQDRAFWAEASERGLAQSARVGEGLSLYHFERRPRRLVYISLGRAERRPASSNSSVYPSLRATWLVSACFSGRTNVMALPLRPARPVRPVRWT